MTDKAKDLSTYREQGQKWLSRIRAAERREESWFNDAEAAEAIYTADSKSNSQ